jgi:hypothetical protein
MVNKTLLPGPGTSLKNLSIYNLIVFRLGMAFALYLCEARAWESLSGSNGSQSAWEGGPRRTGENYRWRIRFSSDYRGK